MKLSLLYEADMSRRDFLGFLGKAGAAAVGAPLGKLDLSKLGGLEQLGSVLKPVRINFFPGKHFGDVPGYGGTLSASLDKISATVAIFKKLISGRDIYDEYDYDSYSYYHKGMVDIPAMVSKLGLKKYVMGGTHISWTDDGERIETPGDQMDSGVWYAQVPGGHIQINDLEQEEETWGHKNDNVEYGDWETVVTDPIKNFWEKAGPHYLNDAEDLVIDQKGLDRLEQSGIDSEEVVRQREADDKWRENRKLRRRRERDKSQPREVGYEKENMWDPQASRLASELGPFESRLREILTISHVSKVGLLQP